MKKNTYYKVRSIIICDDVRREDNGKEILIGVYASSIIVSEFPAVLPSLAIRIEVAPLKQEFDAVEFALKDPKGEYVMRAGGAFRITSPELPAALTFKFGNVEVMAGKYEIHFGMDEPSRRIGTFFVQQRSTHAGEPPSKNT